MVQDEENRETMILFFSDFSERKTLRERLLESEEKYRSIVETAKDAILSIDEDWKIHMANPAAEEVLGYDPEEMVGMDIRLLLPPRFAENWDIIRTYTSPNFPPCGNPETRSPSTSPSPRVAPTGRRCLPPSCGTSPRGRPMRRSSGSSRSRTA
jgi:PAS domain-containing protein